MTTAINYPSQARKLISAVQQDSLHYVRKLVHNKHALTYIDRSDFSPLHHAVYSSSIQIINALIAAMHRKGISVDIENRRKITPLISAVCAGREDVVLRLLEEKANPNQTKENGFSILHEAAYWGLETIFCILRNKGANFTHVTDDGSTALLLARNMGHKAFYKSIKPLNVTVTEYSRVVRQRKLLSHMLDLSGTTTLAHPDPNSNKEVVVALTGWWQIGVWDLIIKRGAHFFKESPTIQEACFSAIQDSDESTDILLNRYSNGRPIVLNTGFSGHYISVILWDFYFILCNRGCEKGRTTCEAFFLNPKMVNSTFITTLRDLNSKPNEEYKKFLNTTFPLRMHPPEEGSIRTLLEDLLSLPEQKVGNCTWANAEAAVYALLVLQEVKKQPYGVFPIQENLQKIAAEQLQVLKSWQAFMIAAQVNSYLRKPKKETAATRLYCEDWDLLQRVEAKAPQAFRANEIASLKLLSEIQYGQMEDVKLAIQKGAWIHYVDGNGDSALHHAARINRIKIVKFLLAHGANAGCLNNKGETALYQARKRGHKRLYTFMKSLDVKVAQHTQEFARKILLKEMLSLNKDKKVGACDYREIWNVILKKGEHFFKQFPVILKACQSAAYFSSWDSEKLLAHYDNGKNPILIHTGYVEQYVSVVLWGSFFIICNRASNNNTCEFLYVQPHVVDERFISHLQSLQGKSQNEFTEFLNIKFPSRLTPPKKGTRKAVLEHYLGLKPDNSSWANHDAAIYVLFIMHELMKLSTFPTAQKLQELVKTQKKNFDDWRAFMLDAQLTRYMKHPKGYTHDWVLLNLVKKIAPIAVSEKINNFSFMTKDLMGALEEISN